jgi:hypothetical protein
MERVGNENLSLTLDVSTGISLLSIFDEVQRHQYLPNPSMLFEFSMNNGPARQSDSHLAVEAISLGASDELVVQARA